MTIKKQKLKTPSDYDQFYFRIKSEDKTQIEELIKIILKNQNKDNTARKLKRNELLTKAIIRYLNVMIKKMK